MMRKRLAIARPLYLTNLLTVYWVHSRVSLVYKTSSKMRTPLPEAAEHGNDWGGGGGVAIQV